MANKPLSDDLCLSTLRAYAETEGNQVWAAKRAGVNCDTFKSRLRTAKGRFPKFVKDWPASTGSRDSQRKPPATLAEDVDAHRRAEQDKYTKAKLKEAAAKIASLEEEIGQLRWGNNVSFKPAEWTLPARTPKKREHMPYLLTSDFQVGEVVRAEETEAGYGFSPEIFSARYRRMVDTTIYLSFEHGGQLWKYPGIVYARGGDTIDGKIHPEDNGAGTMTPTEAVELCFAEESAGIEKLADAFGRVEVKTPGAAGNHDRINLKPVSKKAHANSYDRLIAFMLKNHFRGDKRITFQTSESFDVRFNIYDMHILLTHGDRMGSGGGQGFIGPLATIMRGAQKVIAEQAALGYKVDRVDHGHFHTPAYIGWVLSNGCMPGYSEFAKSFRMRPTPPQQSLLYHHPKRGVVNYWPIQLRETTNASAR